ncbi:MAG: DUF393 domain-containing protein [Acidimicrobiia bacterium]|nr:DUF393 domain-containing protein [Acidimicrobiia bacterium]
MSAPTRSVLLYDGDCGFCTRCALFIGARLVSPAQVATAQQVTPADVGLSSEDLARSSWWIDDRGRPHGGASAMASALRETSGGWRLLGRLLSHPPLAWAAAVGYPLVVRFRHRLPGASDACALAPADESPNRPRST